MKELGYAEIDIAQHLPEKDDMTRAELKVLPT